MGGLEDDEESGAEAGAGSSGHRFAFALAGLLVIALIGGLATVGFESRSDPGRDRRETERGGCLTHELEFLVTDDPKEYDRQQAFELTNAPVPEPAFYDRPLEPVSALHAASHRYVVVLYREGLEGETLGGLQALQARGLSEGALVLTAPRVQQDAIVAIGTGWQLNCAKANLDSVRETIRFAGETYPTLGQTVLGGPVDPRPPVASPPAVAPRLSSTP